MTFSLSVVIFIVLSVLIRCVYTLQVDHNLRKDFDLVEYEAVDLQSYHQIVIALKQNNLDYLEAFVHRVSDPSSDNYGKYLSRNEVGELTRNVKCRQELFEDKQYIWIWGDIIRRVCDGVSIVGEVGGVAFSQIYAVQASRVWRALFPLSNAGSASQFVGAYYCNW